MAQAAVGLVCEFVVQTVRGASKNDEMNPQQLKRLADHKYSATDSSILDRLIMNRFWSWLVLSYPLWLAPNLITSIGLFLNISSALVLSYYCPDGVQPAPWWAYLFCAVGLFIYQALDATDGKQARRTNSSSPLGEWFDHGCDSLSQVFVTLESCLALQLGVYPTLMLFVCLYSVFLFYCAHWQTYVSGTLRFHNFDVTEAQFTVIFLCLISAVFGPGVWSTSIFGLDLKLVFMGLTSALAIAQLLGYMNVVFTGGVGKNGSTVAGTSVLFPVIPVLAAIVPFFIVFCKSTSNVFHDHIVLYCITGGLVTAKVTNRLIIAHMSKSELISWDTIYYTWVLLIGNQYFNNFFPEYPLLVIACIYSAVNLLCFCYTVCTQIADFLRITCFTIPHPPPAPVTSSSVGDKSASIRKSSQSTAQR